MISDVSKENIEIARKMGPLLGREISNLEPEVTLIPVPGDRDVEYIVSALERNDSEGYVFTEFLDGWALVKMEVIDVGAFK